MLDKKLVGGQTFPNISPLAFQHPHDLRAVEALRKIPLLDTLQKFLIKNTSEKSWNLHLLSCGIRLGPNQGKSIYDAFVYASKILDLETLPDIFIINQSSFNAYSSGVEKYSITLTSELVDTLDEDELLAVIGHELGHIKCQHMLYKNMASFISTLGLTMLNRYLPGIGAAASAPLLTGLLHWSRMAEFSCDRAALLVTQKPEVVKRTTVMIAAGSKKILPDLNIDAVLQQASEWTDDDGSLLDRILILQRELQMTHPVPVLRCKEIHDWSSSKQYQDILAGHYKKVTDFDEPPPETQEESESQASVLQNIQDGVENIFGFFRDRK